MTQRLVIEGEMVHIEDITISQSLPLSEMLPFIENRPPISMFHPRSAVYTYWNESNPQRKIVRFLCEAAPGIKGIIKSGRRYRLAMPWTYFVFSFQTASDVNVGGNWTMSEHFAYHSNAQVTGPDSRLWSAFLPNVYNNADICFGSTGASVNQPLAARVDQLVSSFYLTEFNDDVIGGRSHPLPFNAAWPTPGFLPWVQATAEHGAAAWVDFPEWHDTTGQNGVQSKTVAEALSIDTDTRLAPRTMVEAIPPIPSVPTFGRAEQWLRDLTPVQRRRLLIGLENIGQADPALIAPIDAVINPVAALAGDGGEPV
jgi:hypothetical protein